MVNLARRAFGLEALRRALETDDAATLTSFYHDDAEIRIVDQDHPPSRPRVLRGRQQIASYYEDICGRNLRHTFEGGLERRDRLAFSERCKYPSGSEVVSMSMFELSRGRVARQTTVQAWDE